LKKTEFDDLDDLREFKNLVGGTSRYYLIKIFTVIFKRKKMIDKRNYTNPPNIDEDYLENKNVNHKNTIAFIFILFFVFSILFKVLT